MKFDNFEFSDKGLTLFNLHGGIPVEGLETLYVFPNKVQKEIIRFIAFDEAEGNLKSIALISVAAEVAIRLWYEKVLKLEQLQKAQKGVLYNGIPYVFVHGVSFGKYSFPVIIFPEWEVGTNHLSTLDKGFRVVGTQGYHRCLKETGFQIP